VEKGADFARGQSEDLISLHSPVLSLYLVSLVCSLVACKMDDEESRARTE
jgi:hypothetical protein